MSDLYCGRLEAGGIALAQELEGHRVFRLAQNRSPG
jgi:hypothetical protein